LEEVAIKGKSMVELNMVDQGEARTVNKAEILVVVSYKDHLGCPFNGFTHTKDFDSGLVPFINSTAAR
jgi:hypothetical protein